VGFQSQRGDKQPIFLSFPTSELLHSWMTLLRLLSCAQDSRTRAEKSYRISRSIQFDIVQATLFGIMNGPVTSDHEDQPEEATSNATFFCEILINSEYAGVTTSQKPHNHSFSWHQSFTFTELPEIASVQVNLKREEKGGESTLLGTCFLDAQDWHRGVQHSGYLAICEHRSSLDGHRVAVGELRFKCKLEE
jgi:hypothetical protein